MPANDYRFVTTWVVAGTCEEVPAVLGDPLDLPLLCRLSFIFKPIFAANHRWAMAQGERCLVRAN